MIGGPATQAYNLCKALVAEGDVPVVVAPGNRFSVSNDGGFRIYRYPWNYIHPSVDRVLRWLVFPPYFFFLLLMLRPHVLHVHSVSASSFIAGFFAKLLRIPRIIKFAGDWVWETLSTSKLRAEDFENMYALSPYARFLLRVERFGLRFFDVIWCPSQFRRENVRRILGSDERVRVIPNALLLPGGGFHEERSTDPILVVSANRFIPHKRIPVIVRSFKEMNIPASQLTLIGTGDQKEIDAVRSAISEEGLEGRISITGRLTSEEVYEHFAHASFYVSASLEEGFPNVFIEAMHFGLPIISTDVGGCKEMVVEGETGFLVNPRDEHALAEKMRMLAGNRALRNTLAKNAYDRSKRYDLGEVYKEFTQLYRELILRG